MTASENTVHYQEKEGGVAIATLDAPAMRNSVGAPGIRDALEIAVQRFENNAALRVLIITGAGGVFSAGGNLQALKVLDLEAIRARLARGGQTTETILQSDKLYIAAVDGPCFGSAVGLVASCDLVCASATARFSVAHVRVGALPDGGMFWSLPLRVGRAVARRLMLTGEEINAGEAERIALVDYVTASSSCLDEALQLATRLAAGAPLSQAGIKRMFHETNWSRQHCLEQERERAARIFASDDFHEGASAFLEKRRAKFEGK